MISELKLVVPTVTRTILLLLTSPLSILSVFSSFCNSIYFCIFSIKINLMLSTYLKYFELFQMSFLDVKLNINADQLAL